MIRTCLIALCLPALAGAAFAAELTAEQTVQKVVQSVDENGAVTETFLAADAVAPGDTVLYTLNYANSGPDAAEDVTLTMPVPPQVVLLEGSEFARNTAVAYSIDGGLNFAERENLFVGEGADVRPATAEDITHMQWAFTADISAGQSGAIGFRGVLR
ncbi:MAG: hypothetical protein AAGH87_01940 [Pseudomonadota bacterium]